MVDTITVTPDTIDSLGRLPRFVRLAFGFAARIRRGTLEAVLPDGRHVRFGGVEPGPAAILVIKNYGFAWRLIRGGNTGIAEAYLRGEWETDLTQFLYLFNLNQDLIQSTLRAKPVVRLWQLFRHWLNRNTRMQAKHNIKAHYDLGNDFYAAWLDPTMTYSSALFEPGINDLSAAQTRKYRSLAERIDLRSGQTVLEIGCGWGGFAEYAAQAYDARVVGLTISQEQYKFARARMSAAGVADRVEIRLKDYRDELGVYDRIVSIEMIEAIGEEFWPDFFRQLRDRLAPNGIAGIQAITIRDHLFASYRREVDFIQRYIFPGGMLPTPMILRILGQSFGIPMIGEKVFGEDYVKTLVAWRERFHTAWPSLVPMGFDERFRRMWDYYFAYCEAGFRAGKIDVRQMVFAKANQPAPPLNPAQ